MSECCGPHFIFKGYYADEHPKGFSHSAMKTMIENPDEHGEGEVSIIIFAFYFPKWDICARILCNTPTCKS